MSRRSSPAAVLARPWPLPRIAAAAAALLAASGLLGWVTGSPILQAVIPGRPAMTPNTALALVLAGTSLWTLESARRGWSGRRVAGVASAAIVLALGAATLAEYATGLDLGIDLVLPSVLPARGPVPVGAGIPGRPAAPTALCLTLLGGALLLLDARSWRRVHPAELLAIAASLVAHALVTGHAYGAELLYRRPGSATGVALHTAVALAALAAGVLLARPVRGAMSIVTSPLLGGLISRRLLVAAIAGPPVLGLVVATAETAGWVPRAPFSYALLASSSTAIASALVLGTAASLNQADATRRRLEAELRRWKDVFDSSNDAVIAKSVDGTVTGWNRAAERIYGWRADEILGRHISAIVPPDRRAELDATLERLRRGERVESLETVRARKDGGRVDVALTISPIADAEGRMIGFSTIGRDVGERKAAIAELARAHERERSLRAQLEALGTASAAIAEAVARIPETDVDAVLQTIALQAQMITRARYAAVGLGADPTRPFDRWVYVGMSPDQAARIGRHPRPVGLLGAVATDGRTIRTRDMAESPEHAGFPPGHPPMRSFLGVPVRYRGRSVGNIYLAEKEGADEFSADDQRAVESVAGRAGTALETARLYGEEALAKQWLQAVIDGMPDGVLLASAAGRVSYNQSALDLARDDVGDTDPSGAPLRLDVRDPTGRCLAWSELPIARALAASEALTGVELIVRDARGRAVPVLASAAPLRDREQRTVGAVCVLRDITSLKRLEELREQWTAVVAHDLRQPLGVISFSAQMLARRLTGAPDPRVTRAIERIRGAAGRMNRMVGDLLDLSRLEAHRLSLHREPTDVRALLAEVVDRAAEALGTREFELRVSPDLPAASVDPGRLGQIVENLLSNAVKYGEPDGGVVVDARADRGEIVVSVTNRGQAIPAEDLPGLFTRFHRAGTPGAAEGIGLGLYITKGLVEAHGGRIWVESAGSTTSFRFTLPAASSAAGAAPEATGT